MVATQAGAWVANGGPPWKHPAFVGVMAVSDKPVS